MIERAIIPIYFEEHIVATAFFTKWKGRQYLVTAGHTFLSENDCKWYYFIDESKKHYLSEFEHKVKFDRNPRSNCNFNDFGIFKLNTEMEANLHLGICEGDINEVYKCYGYNPNLNRLEIVNRHRIDFNSGADFNGYANLLNCRTGFGCVMKGYSGGPIISPITKNVIGMTVIGDDEFKNCLMNRQHFITSDFLLQIIEGF